MGQLSKRITANVYRDASCLYVRFLHTTWSLVALLSLVSSLCSGRVRVRERVIREIGARPVRRRLRNSRHRESPGDRSMNTAGPRVSLEAGLKEDKRENEINLALARRAPAISSSYVRENMRFPRVRGVPNISRNLAN